MADTIKSVLLVDYDSLHRSLSAGDKAAADRLSSRVVAWVKAIEVGNLFAAASEEPPRRRILIRRCYADPSLLGDNRAIFLSNGFQVVDCPPAEGRAHNAAAIHMVLDSIDALDHPTGYEEFVLLSADSDLSPLLIRLRAHNRTTSIYATPVTADSYKAIADAMIEEARFTEILLSDDEPAEAEDEDAAPPPAERSEVEALARRITSATNVPLLSPRTFAELFRHLVEEIADNGYHFQTTAENVATRLADAGRKVTRRQVVFVVKGLALKGHVFSPSDTADRLAEVFREQVTYLAENAGLELDENERRVLSAWIVGGSQPASGQATGDADKSGTASKSDTKPSAARPASQPPSRSSRRRQARSNAQTTTAREESKPAAKPEGEAAKPAADAQKPASKPAEAGKPSPPAATATPATQSRSSTGDKPQSSTTATANRSASAATPSKPGAPARTSDGGKDADKDTVESTILAAIAQAVDVLVEDSGGKEKNRGGTDQAPAESAATKPAPAKDKEPDKAKEEEETVPEGDDIGDEIQRIIASYSRNRGKDDR